MFWEKREECGCVSEKSACAEDYKKAYECYEKKGTAECLPLYRELRECVEREKRRKSSLVEKIREAVYSLFYTNMDTALETEE
jgi:hypothetical protein